MNNYVFNVIRDILADSLDIVSSDINIDMSFSEDLGIDSLDMVLFLLSFEEFFKIEINDEEISDIKTIKEMIDYINSKLK